LFFALLCLSSVGAIPKSDVDILHFLSSIPPAANAEMNAIISNASLTKVQVEQKLDEWAAKQPGNFPSEYQQVKQFLNSPATFSTPNRLTSNHTIDEISQIQQNKSITRLQERTAILGILSRDEQEWPSSSFVVIFARQFIHGDM